MKAKSLKSLWCNCLGFTLVEMMIALVISGILLTGIAVIVTASHKYIRDGRSKVNLQQDMSLIGDILAARVHESVQGKQQLYTDYADYLASGPLQTSGSCLKLYSATGDSVLIYQDNSDLKVVENTSVHTVISGALQSLVFVDSNTAIQTRASLLTGNWTVADTLTHAFRNFANLAWPYGVFASNNILFDSGSGTINGNMHANTSIGSPLSGYTVTGRMTESTPVVSAPTVDWDFFKNIAVSSGQYVVGNKSFNSTGSPFSGVWYLTGIAKIFANVVINGTIVAENDIAIRGDNITIDPEKNYPAALVMDEIRTNNSTLRNNITFSGFVYCGNFWNGRGSNWSVSGALVANNEVHLRVTNTSIFFNPNRLYNLYGITFN